MSVNELTGDYVGVGNTEQERFIDAALQDLMDDMTLPVLEGMIGYFIDASAYLTGDLPDDEDPHDRRGHVEARQALGRLMLWQGWAPPSGSFASQPFTFATPGMGWGA